MFAYFDGFCRRGRSGAHCSGIVGVFPIALAGRRSPRLLEWSLTRYRSDSNIPAWTSCRPPNRGEVIASCGAMKNSELLAHLDAIRMHLDAPGTTISVASASFSSPP